MFEHIADFLKKKETLLHHREPLFFDVYDFLKRRAPHLERHVTPLSYRHGILTLRVGSSGVIQEFHFVKDKLLLFLQRERNHMIRDITTRV